MVSTKIPATVITGFLGAGKTSAIRNLLQRSNGKGIALIINEFGDIGVDRDIVNGCGIEGCNDDNIVELANGCICCTVADDFVPTMEALLDRETPPDHIVIETSGLSLPKPLVKAFNWPEIRTRVSVDGVVTLLDGRAVADGLFAHDHHAIEAQRAADETLDHESPLEELYEEQLFCADMVIINKADLLTAQELAKVEADVRTRLKRQVKIIKSEHGKVDTEVLLGLGAAVEDDLDSRFSRHDHDHDHHNHDAFYSFTVKLPEIADAAALVKRLQALVASHSIYRIKGFAAVAERDMRLVIQGVGHRFQHYFDREWKDDETRKTHLVVIGDHQMDEKAIRATLVA